MPYPIFESMQIHMERVLVQVHVVQLALALQIFEDGGLGVEVAAKRFIYAHLRVGVAKDTCLLEIEAPPIYVRRCELALQEYNADPLLACKQLRHVHDFNGAICSERLEGQRHDDVLWSTRLGCGRTL